MTQDNSYYVYVLCDPRKAGEFKYGNWTFTHKPFYVGKGKGGRAVRHFQDYIRNSATQGYNTRKLKRIAAIHMETGLEPYVKYCRGLTEDAAYAMEERVVAKIGRGRNGPLVNMTDGGLGGTGSDRQPFTPERSKAMSKLLKELAASKDGAYWKAQGAKTTEYWKRIRVEDPEAYQRYCEKNSACIQAHWDGPNGKAARKKQSAGQREIINARNACMTDMDRAKANLRIKLGHLLKHLQSDKERTLVKGKVDAFIQGSRYRLPERFTLAAKELLAPYQPLNSRLRKRMSRAR